MAHFLFISSFSVSGQRWRGLHEKQRLFILVYVLVSKATKPPFLLTSQRKQDFLA